VQRKDLRNAKKALQKKKDMDRNDEDSDVRSEADKIAKRCQEYVDVSTHGQIKSESTSAYAVEIFGLRKVYQNGFLSTPVVAVENTWLGISEGK
jgi:predicted P-loop ATPase/GTPase